MCWPQEIPANVSEKMKMARQDRDASVTDDNLGSFNARSAKITHERARCAEAILDQPELGKDAIGSFRRNLPRPKHPFTPPCAHGKNRTSACFASGVELNRKCSIALECGFDLWRLGKVQYQEVADESFHEVTDLSQRKVNALFRELSPDLLAPLKAKKTLNPNKDHDVVAHNTVWQKRCSRLRLSSDKQILVALAALLPLLTLQAGVDGFLYDECPMHQGLSLMLLGFEHTDLSGAKGAFFVADTICENEGPGRNRKLSCVIPAQGVNFFPQERECFERDRAVFFTTPLS